MKIIKDIQNELDPFNEEIWSDDELEIKQREHKTRNVVGYCTFDRKISILVSEAGAEYLRKLFKNYEEFQRCTKNTDIVIHEKVSSSSYDKRLQTAYDKKLQTVYNNSKKYSEKIRKICKSHK